MIPITGMVYKPIQTIQHELSQNTVDCSKEY
jgi:hypothetical protein